MKLFQFFCLQLNLDLPAKEMHDFIRGNDTVPGAWTIINGEVNIMTILLFN